MIKKIQENQFEFSKKVTVYPKIIIRGHVGTWSIQRQDNGKFLVVPGNREYKDEKTARWAIRTAEDAYVKAHPDCEVANRDVWFDHGIMLIDDDIDGYFESDEVTPEGDEEIVLEYVEDAWDYSDDELADIYGGDTRNDKENTTPSDMYYFHYRRSARVFDQIVRAEGKSLKYNDLDYIEQVVAEYTDSKDFTDEDRNEIVSKLCDHYNIPEDIVKESNNVAKEDSDEDSIDSKVQTMIDNIKNWTERDIHISSIASEDDTATFEVYIPETNEYIGSWDVDLNKCENQFYCGDIAAEIDAVDIEEIIEEDLEDYEDTYIWYGRYDAVSCSPRRSSAKATKKIMFKFNSADYDEANNEFEQIIPEPYSYCKLLGKVLDREFVRMDLERSGFTMIESCNEDINTDDIVEEGWQDNWVEPTMEDKPICNINGLNIYKGTDQYGEEAYYLFPEDDSMPEPGYEEWQTETLELAKEWASSYEEPDDDWYIAEYDDEDDDWDEKYFSIVEAKDSSRSIDNFKKENELTDEMIETLREFYDSEWNEYFTDLDFIDWLYEIRKYEGGTIYSEILEDYMDDMLSESHSKPIFLDFKEFLKTKNAEDNFEISHVSNGMVCRTVGHPNGSYYMEELLMEFCNKKGIDFYNDVHISSVKDTKSAYRYLIKFETHSNLNEGNSVSSQLPDAIDSFLQDIAQITGTISYSDIMKHKYSEEDIEKLRNIRKTYTKYANEMDYEEYEEYLTNKIAPKVVKIVKSSNEEVETEVDDSDIIEEEYNGENRVWEIMDNIATIAQGYGNDYEDPDGKELKQCIDVLDDSISELKQISSSLKTENFDKEFGSKILKEGYEAHLKAFSDVKKYLTKIIGIIVADESFFQTMFEDKNILNKFHDYLRIADTSCRVIKSAGKLSKKFGLSEENKND